MSAGWMYRFHGGLVDGQTLGPIELVPPERLLVSVDSEGYRVADYDRVEQHLGEGVVHYHRMSMSELSDEAAEHPHIMRGAEYELAS
jgi:hypothetical protein